MRLLSLYRRSSAAIAAIACAALVLPTVAPAASASGRRAVAKEAVARAHEPSAHQAEDEASAPKEPARKSATEERPVRHVEAESAPADVSPLSLPVGGEKTGVSSQAVALPQGAGKVGGLGESFSAQLSTGIATLNVPFTLPSARGGVSPSLSLSYSSNGGHGIGGIGWDLGVPYITRQTDRGLPRYEDPPPGGPWFPRQDRFVFNGGQELVPICSVVGRSCSRALPGEEMPVWGNGWQYFRARVEGSFLRFFWSPDHRTWRVQSKPGETMEIGQPLDGSVSPGAIETAPDDASKIFRWNLTRHYDTAGLANPAGDAPPRPLNVIVYRYRVDGGMAYLSDVYDTPPRLGATTAPLAQYAHHTQLRYEPRPDTTLSYRRGWEVRQALRLAGVDVTSKTVAGGVAAARALVRRYHVGYDPDSHVSLLTSVQIEGRCATAPAGPSELNDETLPAETNCKRLPAMTFAYRHVDAYAKDGTPATSDLRGYEGFDERVREMISSPPHSLDEETTELFDVDADSLPDVLVTTPGAFGGAHGVFWNGGGGAPSTFTSGLIAVTGVLGENAGTLTLRNANVSIGDLDGDGLIDLVHMPRVKTYSIYSPRRSGASWTWAGRAIDTASAQSPKIDLRNDARDLRRVDVNGDGLVDVVVTTGTEVETFFALGKFADGDGQFGHAEWTSATTASISNDPVTACVPWAGTPVRFGDSDVRLADMNGDGLADIVKVHEGSIEYWPGRGNGYWGTGAIDDCPGGTFGQNRSIPMAFRTPLPVTASAEVRLDDVNGDGLDDLVHVRFQAVDIWLNVDGTSWTTRHTIAGTPAAPSFQNRVRLVDINGSGTRDILWGDGNRYRYIDLAGGTRPWVLSRIENGLGKTTTLDYATSTALMLEAQTKPGLWEPGQVQPWESKTPLPLHLVTRGTEHDALQLDGRSSPDQVTEYTYRDPVYDGRQREFRGFRRVRAKQLGDASSPTSFTETAFLLGDCKDESAADPVCSIDRRWRDNPREALKGLPVTTETFDELGVRLNTTHHTYRLRRLYTGADGREVRHAFESSNDKYVYDVAQADTASSVVSLTDVELETAPPAATEANAQLAYAPLAADTMGSVTLRGRKGRSRVQSAVVVDVFGNTTQTIQLGCIEGCPTTDDTINSFVVFARNPTEPTGWLWRPRLSYVVGSNEPGVRRGEKTTVWNDAGKPERTDAVLSGTLLLDRFHEDRAKRVAPAPPEASKDGGVFVSGQTYDDFLNATAQTAANHRCRQTAFDEDYAQLPSVERIFVGPVGNDGCGTRALIGITAYDRGLGAATLSRDVHGEVSTAAYDVFGRMIELRKPHPSILGIPSPHASVLVEYFLPADWKQTPYTIVHTQTADGKGPDDVRYRERWGFVDGSGRTILSRDEADPSAEGGDGGDWVVSGFNAFDAKGAVTRAYLPWFQSGDPRALPASAPTSLSTRQRHDAFGRTLQTFGLDGATTSQSVYHALTVDRWDAADLEAGPHHGTFMTVREDGHGRVVQTTDRVRAGGHVELRDIRTAYLATGVPYVITRERAGSPSVVRWIRYDTLGRMVLNVEPDTTTALEADPHTPAGPGMKAWRYAYNDSGDLVGISDARGCGANYHYDAGGRVVGEDYSPCLGTHADYTEPTAPGGFEVVHLYDEPDPDAANVAGFPVDGALVAGRLASITDRGAKTVFQYDGRGRVTASARRVAAPDGASASSPYAPRWYVSTSAFDEADRARDEATGAVEGGALDVRARVLTEYTRRGTVGSVTSDHGALVTHVTHAADGPAIGIEYGDAARTTTAFQYDPRRRLASVQTYRGPPSVWSSQAPSITPPPNPGGPPSTLQLLLEDLDFQYDAVDDPVEIRDWRLPGEWPAGAQPVTRKFQYDDLYRITRVDYRYPAGRDRWISPFDAENTSASASTRAKPSPHVAFDSRVLSQSFAYDWLGNTSTTTDDAGGFYDRSLGAVTNGTAGEGPYQLKAATTSTGARAGRLTAAYDPAGNMTALAVKRDGPCLPERAVCSQRFAYDWDEVGRLVRARRWDRADPGDASEAPPATVPDADLRYAYDATDDRVRKTAVDPSGAQTHTVYPFDALELRRAPWKDGDYERTPRTEAPYLFVNHVRLGRVVYGEEDLPALTSGATHVFLEILDHLGSTGIVIDRDTSELVERSTYLPYGGAESDYRPERWKSFREDYRFTGKEDDIEVGLQYFGKRYLAPALGRWMSADPVTVHALSADPNAYAYVNGAVMKAVDPQGLDPAIALPVTPPPPPGEISGVYRIATRGAARLPSARSANGMTVFYWGKPFFNWWIKKSLGLTPEQNDFRNDCLYRTPDVEAVRLMRRRLQHGSPANDNAASPLADPTPKGDSGGPRCMTPEEWASNLKKDRIAKSNASEAEKLGFQQSLDNGEIPIQGLKNVNVPGPDWITFDVATKTILVWDSKFNAQWRFPKGISDETLKRWKPQILDAIACLPVSHPEHDIDIREEAAKAFEEGRIEGRIFKAGPGPNGPTTTPPAPTPAPAPATPTK
jgi:RHS repeat-associated protein